MDNLQHRLSRVPVTWMAALAAMTLLGLGIWQYQAAEQLSRALRDRLRASLQAAAERFGKDFDRELTRVVLYFRPPPPFLAGTMDEVYTERFRRWGDTAPFPELVQSLVWLRRTEDGASETLVLSPGSEHFEVKPCPADLTALCSRLEARLRRNRDAESPEPQPELLPLDAEASAVVVPLWPRRSEGRRNWRDGDFRMFSFLVIGLDPPTIRETMFPEMVRRNFAVEGLSDYRITVFREGEDPAILFDNRPADGPAASSGDAKARLFRLLPLPDVRRLELELGVHLWHGSGEGPGPEPPENGRVRRERGASTALRYASELDSPAWKVVVTHPDGSLQAVASRVRWNNRLIGLGMVALLGFSVLTIWLAARQSQQLARQQLEFIAGVTHELLTPLAAMRSAGQNLADGVVRDEERIRRYGNLIDGEGRRLTEMVGQVLDFAGMQARQGARVLEPVSVDDLIDGALEDSGALLAAGGFEVEVQVAEGLPELRADRAALDKALRNLIANALKYAAAGHWLRLGAGLGKSRTGPEIRIEVEDRGPGILAEDVPHLFEPFYRGRGLAASGLPGSGLGLALVRHVAQQHGGRVSVETAEGRGSTFTLHLPVKSGAAAT